MASWIHSAPGVFETFDGIDAISQRRSAGDERVREAHSQI
jgi:hypothetical protein